MTFLKGGIRLPPPLFKGKKEATLPWVIHRIWETCSQIPSRKEKILQPMEASTFLVYLLNFWTKSYSAYQLYRNALTSSWELYTCSLILYWKDVGYDNLQKSYYEGLSETCWINFSWLIHLHIDIAAKLTTAESEGGSFIMYKDFSKRRKSWPGKILQSGLMRLKHSLIETDFLTSFSLSAMECLSKRDLLKAYSAGSRSFYLFLY